MGASAAETVKVEQILCEVQDLRNTATGLFYGGNEEKLRAHLAGSGAGKSYAKFESWLAAQGTSVCSKAVAPLFVLVPGSRQS